MADNPNLQLINKINLALVGTLDFKELAKQATQIVLQELDLAAVAIFRVDHMTNEMRPYAYATKIRPAQITRIARQPFPGTPLAPNHAPENLTAETARTGKINTSASIKEFDKSSTAPQVQKTLATRFHISLPLKTKGKTEGVLFCATQQGRLTPEQLSLLKTAADQLGLAIENVMAHEQIIAQYKESLLQGEKKVAKIPKIKFTLRITKEIEQFLTYKIANTKQSKADYVRTYLEKRRLEDPEYKTFLAGDQKLLK